MARNLVQRFFGNTPVRRETPRIHVGAPGFDGYTDVRSRVAVKTLVVQGSVDVYYRRSEDCAVVVGGDSQAACNAVETRFQGSLLTVSGGCGNSLHINSNSASININMSSGDSIFINGRQVNGNPDVGRAAVLITQPEAPDVRISGSGDVDLAGVEQESLVVVIQGSGDIRASGSVNALSVKLMGSGDVDASGLAAQMVVCTSMGSGDIEVFAARSVTAHCMGSGDVCIHGNPRDRDTSVMGSGDLSFE